MLKSPMKFSSRLASVDVSVPSGSSIVAGLPGVDLLLSKPWPFLSTGVSAVDDEITLSLDHPFVDGEVISFVEDGGLPAGLTEDITYWINVLGAGVVKVYETAPGSSLVDLTSTGAGTNYIKRHARTKFALLVNYGSNPCVCMGCQDDSDAITDPDEWPVLHPDTCRAMLLDVTGYKAMAFWGLGGTTSVRITPLENY